METDPQAKPKAKTSPRTFLILGVLGIIAGAGLAMLGWKDTSHLLELRKAKTHVTAEVTDDRVNAASKGGAKTQVRYNFSVDGKRYTYTDATGRKNLWASMERSDWQDARESRTVDVVYAKSDPWINQPDKAAGIPILDTLAGLLVGIGFFVAGLAALLAWRRTSNEVADVTAS